MATEVTLVVDILPGLLLAKAIVRFLPAMGWPQEAVLFQRGYR